MSFPDVFVHRHNNNWRVELNPDNAPRLRINSQYARLVRRADSSTDNLYLRNHLQEARWFLKSLKNRNQTLLRVASCIVERQREFLESGEEWMKPLVLRDIAEAMQMHESTISRVTTQKYMHTRAASTSSNISSPVMSAPVTVVNVHPPRFAP